MTRMSTDPHDPERLVRWLAAERMGSARDA
jgi:hypothetical protein